MSGLTIFLLIILVVLLFIYSQSTSGIVQAEEETVDLVSLDYSVEEVNKFYWFTSEESYFSLDFVDSEGNRIYAIIAQDGGDIEYFDETQIITQQDAMSITMNDNEPLEILNARLGMLDDQPVWEVTYRESNNTLTYYYLDAADGVWVQTIANI